MLTYSPMVTFDLVFWLICYFVACIVLRVWFLKIIVKRLKLNESFISPRCKMAYFFLSDKILHSGRNQSKKKNKPEINVIIKTKIPLLQSLATLGDFPILLQPPADFPILLQPQQIFLSCYSPQQIFLSCYSPQVFSLLMPFKFFGFPIFRIWAH